MGAQAARPVTSFPEFSPALQPHQVAPPLTRFVQKSAANPKCGNSALLILVVRFSRDQESRRFGVLFGGGLTGAGPGPMAPPIPDHASPALLSAHAAQGGVLDQHRPDA